MYDLEAHHWSEHEDVEVVNHDKRTLGRENKEESEECVSIHPSKDQNSNLNDCNLCGEKFITKRSMMEHKKILHIEKVALCWNFSSGKCDFSDEFCWFIHSKNAKFNSILQLTTSKMIDIIFR